MRNGDKKWPFAKIFPAEFFRGASEIWLIDPYLSKHHQRRNLREFLDVVGKAAKLKTINVITSESEDPTGRDDKQFYDSLDRSLFEKVGSKITYTHNEHVHDRFVVVDNGFVFKLGRGLDIYKPVAGLSGADASLRQTRECEIDVFAPQTP